MSLLGNVFESSIPSVIGDRDFWALAVKYNLSDKPDYHSVLVVDHIIQSNDVQMINYSNVIKPVNVEPTPRERSDTPSAIFLSGRIQDYSPETGQTLISLDGEHNLQPEDIINIDGTFFQIANSVGSIISVFGKLPSDFTHAPVDTVFRGIVVKQQTRIVEVHGSLDDIDPNIEILPIILPESKTRIKTELSVINMSYGTQARKIQVFPHGQEKINNIGSPIPLGHRAGPDESSRNISLVTSRNGGWFV